MANPDRPDEIHWVRLRYSLLPESDPQNSRLQAVAALTLQQELRAKAPAHQRRRFGKWLKRWNAYGNYGVGAVCTFRAPLVTPEIDDRTNVVMA